MNKDWMYPKQYCKYCGAEAQDCECQRVPLLGMPSCSICGQALRAGDFYLCDYCSWNESH